MIPILFDPGHDDVAALAALHAQGFADPWTEVAIRELFAGPGVFAFHGPAGFVLARAAGGEAEILTIAVAQQARSRGLGRALLRAAAVHAAQLGAQAMFLEVAATNAAALALYTRQGFIRVGQRKGYYGGGKQGDAWVLRRELPLPQGGDFA